MPDQAQDGALPSRIDKGIKRGPRIRNGKPTNPSDPADLGTWQIPANLDPDEVLQRYLTDSTTSQIAKQYGLSRKALTSWLRKQRPAQWRQAQILRALCTKEDAETGLATAPDALSLARARELLRAGQWELQCLDPDYQPKPQFIPQIQTPTLNIQIITGQSQPQLSVSSQQQSGDAALLPPLSADPSPDQQA